MGHATRVVRWTLAGFAFAMPAAPASAGWLDSLFGSGASSNREQAPRGQREWLIRDYTTVRLVPREGASQPNQQPVRINPEALRQQLGRVQFATGTGTGEQPLFAPGELSELAEPLAQAFENARPDDDVLLLSSARRGGLLGQPVALTARLFVQDGGLQMIVNDARYEFFNNAVGSRTAPEFTFGSRARAGRAVLVSDSASTVRADWLAIPLGTPAAAAAAPALAGPVGGPAPALRTDRAAPAGPLAATPPPASPAPAAAPANRPRDAAAGEEAEQRLLTLKRLRERGLITEEEYQQKRREILAQL